MLVDFNHNRIIADTVTGKFKDCFEAGVASALVSEYGELLSAVQMYEDHINDGFIRRGEFYYPLTVVLGTEPSIRWIKWRTLPSDDFRDESPFAYVGSDNLVISLVDEVPSEFLAKMAGKKIYSANETVKMAVSSVYPSPVALCGKYSQSFVDAMAAALTEKIEKAFFATGIANSSVEIRLVFAPATYMEHTSDNVTYRRLLLSDKGSAPRDFWVKWTRKNSASAYTVNDDVDPSDIEFDIGEDVPAKIREREYRFLVSTDPDKYQYSMGRKNITEWREIVKRAIRRGELEKQQIEAEEVRIDSDINDKLNAILEKYSNLGTTTPVQQNSEEEALVTEELIIDKAIEIAEENSLTAALEGIIESANESVEEEVAVNAEPLIISESFAEPILDEPELPIEEAPKAAEVDIEKIRAEMEAQIRLEYESRARRQAEEEAQRLRREHQALMEENRRLAEAARRAEEERRKEEENRLLEEAKLRARMEAEERERDRIAEAARIALENKKREEEEALRREAAERARREELAREEERARIEEARRLEAERIAREAEERRIEEERQRREAEERLALQRKEEETRAKLAAEQRRLAEEERRRRTELTFEEEKPKTEYTYVRKLVRLIFRHPVDPNVTARIQQIMTSTIKYFNKEDVYIRVKASIPDESTVLLDFVRIPEEENELLINIIKVLGNSGLGIGKVTVE